MTDGRGNAPCALAPTAAAGVGDFSSLLGPAAVGSRRIRIAVLDGAVDRSHVSLRKARLKLMPADQVRFRGKIGLSAQHGTYITSLIFGQQYSPIQGIAPNCTGILIPLFDDLPDGAVARCTQIDLAYAIAAALDAGAHVINISGGEFSSSGRFHPLLEEILGRCDRQRVLIVAAAGNEGCDCAHIPAVHPSILAVGAANRAGEPLPSSNWGAQYRGHGILAVGERILGAAPGNAVVERSGTSAAAAIVAGVAGLLMSLAIERGARPDGPRIRRLLIDSSDPCPAIVPSSCRRYLSGVLNAHRALFMIDNKDISMNLNDSTHDGPDTSAGAEGMSSAAGGGRAFSSIQTSDEGLRFGPFLPQITPSDCSCGGSSTSRQFVFAIGKIEIAFANRARYDSLCQHLYDTEDEELTKPFDIAAFLTYLEVHPWEATSVIWTLTLESVPIYAIAVDGPNSAYVIKFLIESVQEQRKNAIDRVSIAGVLGRPVALMTGEQVPMIHPELRGTSSLKIDDLVNESLSRCNDDVRRAAADVRKYEDDIRRWTEQHRKCERDVRRYEELVGLLGTRTGQRAQEKLNDAEKEWEEAKTNLTNSTGSVPVAKAQLQRAKEQAAPLEQAVRQFLERVYYGRRNIGLSPPDRAINYLATNLFALDRAFKEAAGKPAMQLHSIDAAPAQFARVGSDCWDVRLEYFYRDDVTGTARRVYRITVDVNDVVPVTIGKLRYWPSAD